MPVEDTVTIEGAQLVFRNFEGRKKQYNDEGKRNFAVLLAPDVAEEMIAIGWNVKFLKPREEELAEDPDMVPQAFLEVAVDFEGYKPSRIIMLTSRGRTNLDEDTAQTLDGADIAHCDLIVRPYNWDVNGKQGTKAYLQSMYVTIEEDELDLKYSAMERENQTPQ